jgi:hypothetical protein
MSGSAGSEETGKGAEDVATSGTAGLDSTAAMLRAESEHVESTLGALVTRLSSVPGLETVVSYRHGKVRKLVGDLPYINDLNRRSGPIEKLVVAVGRRSYWLDCDRSSIRCGRKASSIEPGQTNEELPFSIWARSLFDDIAQQNLVSHSSMVALRHLVEHDLLD